MTMLRKASLLLAVAPLFVSGSLRAAMPCCQNDQTPTAVVSQAADDYPLMTCVVSGEKLGEMGPPIDYIYKEEGKPDRLVRFCCKNCIKKFTKEPAKYLKKIDDAAAAKAGGMPATAPSDGAHHH